MAHFRGWVKGMRGLVSRLGAKTSGIVAQISGWNCGVNVRGYHRAQDNKDVFIVTRTDGSNGGGTFKPVAEIVEGERTKITLEDNI